MFTNRDKDKAGKPDGAAGAPTPVASTPRRPSGQRSSAAPSIISADLSVKGSLTSTGDVHVEGNVDGDIEATSLTIGENATVNGEVCAEDLTVKGRVLGSIRALRVHLASTAHIEGDIAHQSLAVEAGAHFDGQVRHSQDPLGEPRKPRLAAPSTAASADTQPRPFGSGLDNGASKPAAGVAGLPTQAKPKD